MSLISSLCRRVFIAARLSPLLKQNFQQDVVKTTTLLNVNHQHQVQQTAGLKRRLGINRMCKDCKVTRFRGRLAVVCPTHPRHNQLQWGRGQDKQLHKPYPWRWLDPFEKKYSDLGVWNEDRYSKTFED